MSEIQSEQRQPQEANTIILELGRQKKDHIRDLLEGRGRIFKKVARTISQLQKSGEVGKSVQPVIVIVKQKKSSRNKLWD
jgi:hypothetical protein